MPSDRTDIGEQLEHPRRGLPLSSIENARDLGGYQTQDGRRTQFGIFLRTADMDQVSTEDRNVLTDHGLSLVIDLRMQRERTEKPNVYSADGSSPLFRVHDFWGDRFDTYRSPDKTAPPARKLADLYCAGLRQSGFVMADIMRSLAAAEGAAAFHCRSGKDRTGLVAAMLLAVAGVPDETICADFALTDSYLRSDAVNPIEPTAPGAWQRTCAPETMEMTLSFVHAEYGGVPGYLREVGVSDEDLALIRQKFV